MKNTRIDVLEAFSECLKDPSPNWRKELPNIVSFLESALSSFNTASITAISGALSNAPDLQAEFARSFLFPVETRVVPVESIYRPWTVDPTATMSFAHSKGYLLGDAAHHMKHLYELYGLNVPAELNPVPDHLCLQLEFAALLLKRGEIDNYFTFIKEHLSWVVELVQEAAEKQIPMFYRLLLQSLAEFLSHEHRAIEQA